MIHLDSDWPSIPAVISLFIIASGLHGTLPTQLTMLRHLRNLQLSDNAFVGTLPEGFCQLDRLTDLEAANNKLTGLNRQTKGRARPFPIKNYASRWQGGSAHALFGSLPSYPWLASRTLTTYHPPPQPHRPSSWMDLPLRSRHTT